MLDQAPSDAPPPEVAYPAPRADLGVLFVHGIGTQARGQTLSECASAVVDWWRAWVGSRGGRVTVERTALVPEPACYEPAHAEVAIAAEPAGATRYAILAESWWGADFTAPTFRDVASWMLTFGSWIVIGHVLDYARTRWGRAHRWLAIPAELIGLLGAAAVLCLVQLLLLLLALVAVLPIASIRRWVATAVLSVEAVIGDSYAFSANPVVGAAVASRVRRDIEWLSARCRAVVVVAHSQGAAVAVRALEHHLAAYERWQAAQTPEFPPVATRVRRLITYGSGLVKLTQLELMAKPPRRYHDIIPYLWLIVLAMALAGLSVARTTYLAALAVLADPGPPLRDFLLTGNLGGLPIIEARPLEYFVLWAVVLGGFGLIQFFREHGDRDSKDALDAVNAVARRLTAHLHWTDLYATKDPVPAGPLPVVPTPRLASRQVTNFASFLRDHVTYWRNPDEFVSALVGEFAAVCRLFTPPDDTRLARAAAHRRRRIQVLVWVQRLFIACVGGILLFQATWLTALGRTLLAPLMAGTLPEGVSRIGRALAASQSSVPQAIAAATCFALGAALPALAGWVWYRLPCREAWEYWDRTEVHILLRGDQPNPLVGLAVTVLVGGLGILLAVSVRAAGWGFPQIPADVAQLLNTMESVFRWSFELVGGLRRFLVEHLFVLIGWLARLPWSPTRLLLFAAPGVILVAIGAAVLLLAALFGRSPARRKPGGSARPRS